MTEKQRRIYEAVWDIAQRYPMGAKVAYLNFCLRHECGIRTPDNFLAKLLRKKPAHFKFDSEGFVTTGE